MRKGKTEHEGIKNWEIMRGSMMSAADIVLGWENRRQPDWFQENITILQQQIMMQNKLFSQWLKIHHHRTGRGMWHRGEQWQRNKTSQKHMVPE